MNTDNETNPGSFRYPGFSLIELLVSIAIIAVLIGILLPALGGAMGSARSVRCQANLRSLVTGLQMYRDDNKGDIPWAVTFPHTIDNPEPFLALTSYLDVSMPQGVVGEDVTRLDPFVCPSDKAYSSLTGFSYSYRPASFMQVSPEEWSRADMRRILKLYTEPQSFGAGLVYPRGFAVLSDRYRFHVDEKRRADMRAPDQTGMNLAYLDGSVRKGGK
ncbi:MAG: type II secretion system protein [Magnetovibrio sp.]|nr:type II secretion system protein [Magnetovibrio sp.]